MAMITAMPEVMPVMTGAGTNAVRLPRCSTAAINSMMPARKVAANIPCIPVCQLISEPRIAAIAPVGPDI